MNSQEQKWVKRIAKLRREIDAISDEIVMRKCLSTGETQYINFVADDLNEAYWKTQRAIDYLQKSAELRAEVQRRQSSAVRQYEDAKNAWNCTVQSPTWVS